MIILFSLVTSAKDYFEIVHKLIEFHPTYSITDYNELGSLISYIVLTIKNFFSEILTFNWLQNLWSLPIIVPDIASAMISEISVLDGYFHNALTFLETPLSYGKQNYSIYGLEKFSIGFINSFFLFLPTSAAHIIMLRRFVFQGIEAGYIAGFGIIAGNLLWLASIIFGWRFFVIPWLSLDILRYLLGFVILIKYMWHASHDERRTSVSTNLAKSKIFLVTFLLALTEQTSLFPFVTNMSVGAESTILENFPVENLAQFLYIHSAYLFGIFAGSLSFLHFTCWLWENPIYKLYIWFISNSSLPFNLPKSPTTNFYKYLNFIFLYLTMLCTITSIPYFGLDYTLTNPLGFLSDDRILYQINKKTNQPELPETSFLSLQASDRNTRDSRGRHGRRERWKDRLIKYRGMDTSLYDQSVYDLFTIEDLNYGFDKFWLRRKIKNHHSRFRMVIFQPWLLSLKKQLAKPRLISNDGVRVELFRMLYEQFYHPNFHAYLSAQKTITKPGTNETINKEKAQKSLAPSIISISSNGNETLIKNPEISLVNKQEMYNVGTKSLSPPPFLSLSLEEQEGLKRTNSQVNPNSQAITTSALRKFIRKINTRVKSAQILSNRTNLTTLNNPIYSKNSQSLINPVFTKIPDFTSKLNINLNQLNKHMFTNSGVPSLFAYVGDKKKEGIVKKKDRQILRYKTLFNQKNLSKNLKNDGILDPKEFHNAKIMLHPIKFYLQKEKAFKRKWKFYGANIFRKLSIENNAPYFRIMMKRLFYYYKPTLRWTNTLKLAKNKQGHKVRRKKSRTPLIYNSLQKNTKETNNNSLTLTTPTIASTERIDEIREKNSNTSFPKESSVINLKKPTHNYRVVGKNASRYRYQIYKDVLHHWYYTPFNRLLLKFDIDAFIRRQPNPHFLTKKEEQELHLKRFLLAEHYETLRWYTYMQHYRSMKTNIGGTKSFASRVYNHQFQGTFKKLRHLFAITPTLLSNQEIDKSFKKNSPLKQVLKFDQPLYNEYSNTQKNSIVKESVSHEELLSPIFAHPFIDRYNNFVKKSDSLNKFNSGKTINDPILKSNGNDLISQSTLILKEYLKTSKEKRQETIKNLLLTNNYKEFTKFLFSGQKLRGLKATTNQLSLNKQEKEYLNLTNSIQPLSLPLSFTGLPEINKNNANNTLFLTEADVITPNISTNNKKSSHYREARNTEQDLWFSFLKNYKKGFYDQEFLTKFLERRTKKKEKRQLKKEKELKNRLKRLKTWLAPNPQNLSLKNNNQANLLTTGIKNAIKDGVLNLKGETQDFIPTAKAVPNSLDAISTILIKLNNDNKLRKQNKNIFSRAESYANTTFLKTRILSHIILLKTKEIFHLSLSATKKKLLKPLFHKDPIFTWDIKDKTLKKRKRSRKKYTKEIKKAQITLINSIKEQKKIIQKTPNISLNEGQNSQNSLVTSLPYGSARLEDNNGSVTASETRNNLYLKETLSLVVDTSPTNLKQNIFKLMPITIEKKNVVYPNVYLQKTKVEGLNRTEGTDSANKLNTANIYTRSFFENKKNQINLPSIVGETESSQKKDLQVIKRKKKLSDNEILKSSVMLKHSSESPFDKLNLNKKEINFLYFNTLYGKKFEIKQDFRRKKTKNRRNQRYGRPHHRVEHPSFNANLERKSANMVPEKRLQILKEQAELNYGPTKNGKNKPNFALNPKKRKSKQRNWKKFKKGINNEKLRKARKQNRDTIATQRTSLLTKQIKHIKFNLKLQEWWWKQFLPNRQATANANWQLEKERQLEKTISKLSKTEILERDFRNLSNRTQELQIGDYDFKPLAIPQALRIRDNLIKQNQIGNVTNDLNVELNLAAKTLSAKSISEKSEANQILPKIVTVKENPFFIETSTINKNFLLTTNPLPFYAGWDESLRKFVVTNRLLSRREAGYSINGTTPASLDLLKGVTTLETKPLSSKVPPFEWQSHPNKIEFTNAPLQGMNAGTTLYCQVPFTTFDPDQLFSKGMDGFAPIGWRRFDFTHTIFKTQSLLKKNISDQKSNTLKPLVIQKNLFAKLDNKTKKINFKKPNSLLDKEFDTIKKYTNYSRRLKKHYKRIKKLQNEKVPVFLISGALIHEVLPIHYINVFNKQNRLSRDRYLKRRLRRGKKGVPKAIKEFNLKNATGIKKNAYNNKNDFTLRRRLKTRRKYHRKPYTTKGIEIRPRRHKFLTELNTKMALDNIKITQINKKDLRQRPSKRKLKKNRDYDGSLTTKERQRQKIKKTGALNSRLRQLRRRVSRQVLKTVPRRRPRAGGFLWPGDYLRLEQTESPKLILQHIESNQLSKDSSSLIGVGVPSTSTTLTNTKENNLKDSNKQKITRNIDKKSILLDLYVQPRKYLLEKHNIKVIKKKLEKAQHTYF